MGTIILIIYIGEAISSMIDSIFRGIISLKNTKRSDSRTNPYKFEEVI